ncbi:MAG: glycosyltransferase [Candidatus Omnitrophica bacterium]|nr:glycosyltransferase [Candidatus Omnitrophota bacterium]
MDQPWFEQMNKMKSAIKNVLTPYQIVKLKVAIYRTKTFFSRRMIYTRWLIVRHSFRRLNARRAKSSDQMVSIVVPTLSRDSQADHLHKLRQLLSVYLPSQTHQNYEVIVWCDGPNPKVQEMISMLQDKRIRVFATDRLMAKWGHPQTRMGIEAAAGGYFVRMNDDNKPYAHYLSSLLGGFDHATGVVYGRVVFKGDARMAHDTSLVSSFVIPGDKDGALRRKNVDCMCYMTRMDLAKKYVSFFDDDYGADWNFLEAMLRGNEKIKFIDEIIGDKF